MNGENDHCLYQKYHQDIAWYYRTPCEENPFAIAVCKLKIGDQRVSDSYKEVCLKIIASTNMPEKV